MEDKNKTDEIFLHNKTKDKKLHKNKTDGIFLKSTRKALTEVKKFTREAYADEVKRVDDTKSIDENSDKSNPKVNNKNKEK